MLDPQLATLTRRLAAILAADAANFNRLVAQDEERTLRDLAGHRKVIDDSSETHGGRIVTTAGDSVLAEFSSPAQAVRAAIEIPGEAPWWSPAPAGRAHVDRNQYRFRRSY